MTFADEEKRIKGAFIALERSEERGGGRKRRSTMELHQWMLRRRAERMHSSRAPKKKGTRHAGAKREFYCYLGNMCQKYGKYEELRLARHEIAAKSVSNLAPVRKVTERSNLLDCIRV